jgi:hypothetical protein
MKYLVSDIELIVLFEKSLDISSGTEYFLVRTSDENNIYLWMVMEMVKGPTNLIDHFL